MSFQAQSTDIPHLLSTNAGPIACPRCHYDLARLPEAASFCPHCGQDLHSPVAPALEAQSGSEPTAREGSLSVPSQGYLHGIEDFAIPSDIDNRSAILRGFANALFRLGSRYETSLGAQNNPDEARRCYSKAAKLGNSAAQDKLGASAVDEQPQQPS